MRLFRLILLVGILVTTALPATAADYSKVGSFAFTWEGLFNSGRISALGGSDLTDGSPAAILINPSPLHGGNRINVSYDHFDYFLNVEIHTYGGSVEWNAWRLNVAVQELTDEGPIRTAYSPEGTGETYSIRNRMTVLGISYNLGQTLFDHPSLNWSVGADWRHYSTELAEPRETAGSYDLGTAVSWTFDYQGGWTRFSGAVSWQNVARKTFTFDDRSGSLPRPRRVGMTIEMAYDWAGHQGNLFKLLLAYSHCSQLGDTYIDDSEHVGAEALFFDALALRWGNSTRVEGDISSWGIGLVLDERFLGPFTVHMDMGKMGFDHILAEGDETIWGLRMDYAF